MLVTGSLKLCEAISFLSTLLKIHKAVKLTYTCPQNPRVHMYIGTLSWYMDLSTDVPAACIGETVLEHRNISVFH